MSPTTPNFATKHQFLRFAWLAFLLILSPSTSFAFPEMVRHHYPNCVSCHVSPNGGGVLTPYGRELSAEALSTWAREDEGSFAYGLVKTPEALAVGGDVRLIQIYENTSRYVEGRFLFMQADLEAALTLGHYQAVVSAGLEDGDEFITRRHWIGYRPSDQLSFRAGKFLPDYGIKTPDHVISTRRTLGFDEGQETYNVEAAWIGDRLNIFGTGILGKIGDRSESSEKGFALTGSLTFADSIKTGVSYLLGTNETRTRHLAGPWAIIGITSRLFILSELDVQWSKPVGANTLSRGFVNYQRADFEFIKGFHAYVTQEFVHLDFSKANLTESYGLGLQVFPRPHFEINAQWQKMRSRPASSESFNDFAWVLLHYYL